MSAGAAFEIVAAHRSQNPSRPTSGEESLLDDLVLQLLAKPPDLRYQTGISILAFLISGKGLIHDLKTIGDGSATLNTFFNVGEIDRAARFTFPRCTSLPSRLILALYGRDQ